MVSEAMILANCLVACHFRDLGQPAVFRSQQPPRQRLINGKDGTLYQNWMQRRFLSRVTLSTDPEQHAGLGLDAYLTITSPLRKYLDLVTQRQLRAVMGMDDPYSEDELTFVIQAVREPLSRVVFLQQERKRYWILKYLETMIGQREEALVLEKRRQHYVVLLKNYLMETTISVTAVKELVPEASITVVIDQVNAKADKLVVSVV
jgi:exoribonuclease-2